MTKQLDNKGYTIKYLRNIDVSINLAKYMIVGSFIFSFGVALAAFILFKDSILKRKDNPLVMDKNGEIRKTYDIYNDGFETITKKALVLKGHELFFRLEPDEVQIRKNIEQSYYLGDFKALFDMYQTNGYYNSIVQGNRIQYIKQDSVLFAGEKGRFYGKMIIRDMSGANIEKFLITEFNIVERDRTDNNLYGFYMDNINLLKNNPVSESSRGMPELNSINALKE
jgi:hypothetical protein